MLLDTHVALWVSRGVEIAAEQDQLITNARDDQGVYLSAATVWELGNLIRKGRADIDEGLLEWTREFLAADGVYAVDLTADIVLEAAVLPGGFHPDPADRFLVATARYLGVPIMTRDERILEYAQAGHVQAIAC